MSSLKPLQDLAALGMQPAGRIVWIGFGFTPAKHNALAFDPSHLPTDADCACLAGLDVVILIYGYQVRYGQLRRLCGSICQARPRRLQVVDIDYKKVAYLKFGGMQC